MSLIFSQLLSRRNIGIVGIGDSHMNGMLKTPIDPVIGSPELTGLMGLSSPLDDVMI